MKKLENKAEYLSLSELVKLENNPRTIKKADFEKLKTSIKSNPDYFEARPIICSDRTGKNVILGGNQRYEAAKSLGLVEVPVIVLHGLDEAREREIVIRDNVNNGDWTGGTDVDTGATNRKLGSDMGRAVTGGGLHGKDLSKADVSVNIACHIMAQSDKEPVEALCAIGDSVVSFSNGKVLPYAKVVEMARHYIMVRGGFEKLAEWGLF